MKAWKKMAALCIPMVMVAACNPQAPSSVTPTTVQYDAGEATSRAQTVLPSTFTALAATERVVQATRAGWTQAPIASTEVPPSTSAPLPSAETAEGGVPFNRIEMFDDMTGWASGSFGEWPASAASRTWRTTDGGLTWQVVTPAGDEVRLRSAVSGQTAWVTVCTPDDYWCLDEFLRTRDGGVTWENLPSPYRTFEQHLHFFNELDGYLYNYSVAAGSGFYNFRETHDGGTTWSSIAFVNSHQGEPGDDMSWGYPVCNICGDVLYLDLERLIVVGGGDPVKIIPVWVSLDRGATWHRTDIENPTSVDDTSWEEPSSIILLPDNSLLLSVRLISNHFSEVAVAFYSSDDGGLTWTFLSVIQVHPDSRIRVNAPTHDDVFMSCGPYLCVSHDGAQTWEQLEPDFSFDPNEPENFVRTFQFVDAYNGWALVEGESYTLWGTTDGGVTWTMLDPILLP
jgi:photosystem II stability/assembly factor-like uncharacterized protein